MVAAFGSKKAITMTGVFLVLWFSLILVIDLLELFGPSNTDLYTYLAILIPVAIFAAGYIGVAGFRRFVLSLDLQLLTIVRDPAASTYLNRDKEAIPLCQQL